MLIAIAIWLSCAAHLTRSLEVKPRVVGAQWYHHHQAYYGGSARNDLQYDYDDYGRSEEQYVQLLSGEMPDIDDGNDDAVLAPPPKPPTAVVDGTQESSGEVAAPASCQAGSYQPSTRDCSTFLACTRGKLTEVQCPSDMWFDPQHKDNILCNHPEVVCAADNTVCDCAEKYPPLPPDPLIESTVSCLADNRFHFSPSARECGRYFVCFNEHVKRLECRDGFHYNPETERCDFPEIVNCQIADPDCPSEGVRFLAHEERQDAFYFCVHGYKTLQTCPFFEVWDGETDACRPRDDVEVKHKKKHGKKFY